MKLQYYWIIFLGLLLGITSSCAKNPFNTAFNQSYKPQLDCGFSQNVYGERVSWKGNIPIKIYLHQSIPQEYIPAFQSAIKKWEAAAGRALFSIESFGYSGPMQPRQDGLNVIYWFTTWDANRPDEQGRTTNYWIGNEIKESDIRINAKNFDYYLTTPRSIRDIHLESLVIHELGHMLGLKHPDNPDSVMFTNLAQSTTRDTLTERDIEALRCEYAL